MPLFFSSNVLYPEAVMPGWLQAISKINSLSSPNDLITKSVGREHGGLFRIPCD
jgi:hypothetical protein